MRVVLHDDDTMEPLTVLEIPGWATNRLKEGEPIRFPVMRPLSYFAPDDRRVVDPVLSMVTIRFDEIRRYRYGKEQVLWLAHTDDAESALLLRAAFLPGQQSEVQRRESQAVMRGLLLALRAVQ